MSISRPIIPLQEIKEKALQIMCSNSGECVTFGRFISILNEYFEDLNLKYVISPITRIGKPSLNGFVNEFIFERNGYKLYTILKSSQNKDSDNLVYEYLVGKYYINTLIRKLPCFLETYHLFYYTKGMNGIYRMLKDNKINDNTILYPKNTKSKTTKTTSTSTNNINLLLLDDEPIDSLITNSCKHPLRQSILIQHIENAFSLADFLSEYNDIYSKTIDFFQILMQIYIPLGRLMNEFTHNDLHTGNVLLYKIPNNKYVEMIYQLENGKHIRFKTKYIVKLIDYGRCYFVNNQTSSREIYNIIENNDICMNIKQRDESLYEVGYSWFNETADKKDYFISILKGNKSKDLLCAISIHNNEQYIHKEESTDNPILQGLYELLNDIRYESILYEGFELGGLPEERANEMSCHSEPDYVEHQTSCTVDMFSNNLIALYHKHHKLFEEMQTIHFRDTQLFGQMNIYMDLMRETEFNIHPTTSRVVLQEPDSPSSSAYRSLRNSPISELFLTPSISSLEVGKKRRNTRSKTRGTKTRTKRQRRSSSSFK